MDLWRRSAQGRLSEVLGANFIERDAMTRRMQYHGDMRAEWDSYGPDTEAIATAFVRGINAWIDIASERLPEEFALAGWRPERWRPEDLLNRTDAFAASANAGDEVFHARLVASLGASRAETLLQAGVARPPRRPDGLDMNAVTYVVGDALRGVGAPPVFSGLAAPVPTVRVAPDMTPRRSGSSDIAGDTVRLKADIASGLVGSNAWAVSAARSVTGAPMLAADPHRPLDHPSSRYLVHLNAPGWNVIGAAAPWLPGIVIGHNEHVAWAMTSRADDVQDLYAEKVNPANPHQVERAGRWVDTTVIADPIAVKRREKPFPFDREFTPHGVIIASDRARHLAFAVRWTGFEPGTAADLGSLAIDRAASVEEFLGALARWKLPTATFVYATRDGRIGSQAAGLVPFASRGAVRCRCLAGRALASGKACPRPAPSQRPSVRAATWSRPMTVSPARAASTRCCRRSGRSALAISNNCSTIRGRGMPSGSFRSWRGCEAIARMSTTLALGCWRGIAGLPLIPRRRRSTYCGSALCSAGSRRPGSTHRWWTISSFARRLCSFPSLTKPSSVWFDGNPPRMRDALILAALADSVDRARALRADRVPPWGALHSALFRHALAVGPAARSRFNVGPFERAGYAETVMATGGADFEQRSGASLRVILDVGDWDRSVATNAPGQSGAPASPHFADLARLWAAGEYVPLPFSERAVQEHTEATLTLQPLATR